MAYCRRCQDPTPEEVLRDLGGLCLRCLGAFAFEDGGMALSGSSGPSERAVQEPAPLEPGTVFRAFEIVELLARGGMGFVYKARQKDLNRLVALKVLSPRLSSNPDFSRRFAGEAKALASLNHPNIVQVFEYGKEGDICFLAMEYVDGPSLRSLIRQRPLDRSEILHIVPQLCSALEYAHSAGVVHRDIKPENVLLERGGRVKIADFGLARLAGDTAAKSSVTRTDVVMGTPHYMAPEQYDGLKGVDHRADIYSLGVILYEMLTGEVPLGKFEPPSRRGSSEPRLDEVVLRALQRTPDCRYKSVAEMRTDVETAVSRPQAGPAAPPGSARRPHSRWRLPAVLGGAAAMGMACFLLIKGMLSGVREEDLMQDMGRWQWENRSPSSGVSGGELVFVPNPNKRLVEAVPSGSQLGKKFSLRFRYRYLIDKGEEPWFFVIFEASPGSGHERNAIILFSEADHVIAFASRVTGKGWGLRDRQPLPPEGFGPGRWIEGEVLWDDSTKRVRVRINGIEAFHSQLGATDTLDGAWQFGLGGAAREFRVREVRVRGSP